MKSKTRCHQHGRNPARNSFLRGIARKAKGILAILFAAGFATLNLHAQDAQYGVAIPFTISGGFLDTQRGRNDDPTAPRDFVGFRLLATPELKLGNHWYGYAALQVRSTPYFYQDAYDFRIAPSISTSSNALADTRKPGITRHLDSKWASWLRHSAISRHVTMTW